jgi:hypothetical protein
VIVTLNIVPKNIYNTNNNEKKFTVQYTKKELDQIQSEFLEQMNKYIVRVNDGILKTLEEIENETEVVVEVFPSSTTTSSQ